MDLFGSAALALQQIFSLQYMGYLLLGVTLGNIIGVVPGIGGNFCLAILIPFIFWMDPVMAIAFLEGAHASTATGGAVTSILVNVPGDASNSATCIDGFPLTKKGEGGRAVGASAMASGVGGVIGGVVLFFALPIVRPLVLALGPAEIFGLVLFGISMIAYVGEGPTGKALLSGLIGLALSFVGDDPSTGVIRFAFGSTILQDGLQLVPVVIGMFAFSEMLSLIKDKKGIVDIEVQKATFAQVWQGCMDCFVHWWLMVRTSLIGTFLGIIPGMGGTVASFVAYGHAVQTEPNKETFGTGRIEGVIAPEAANNSKEGGQLIPTIAFGIPNSSGMALLLGALMIIGLTPGPKMLTTELPMTLIIVWTLVIGNIFAAIQVILLANPLAKIAALRPSVIVPAVLAVSALGAYAENNDFSSVVIACGFGIVGYVMRKYGFSRATLVIGLVLGSLAEKNYNLSMTLFGPSFVMRPITAFILFAVAAILIWSFTGGRKRKEAAA